MSENIILAFGSARVDLPNLRCAAEEFAWTVKSAHSVSQVASENTSETVAIFFHKSAVDPDCSWAEAIRYIGNAFPGLAIIVCHGFSEPIDWPALCAVGAFHAVWLPLKQCEVRKSLGFVSEARRRAASPVLTPQKRERFAEEPDSPLSAPSSRGPRPRALPSPYLH